MARADREAQLLDVAEEVFSTKGYASATVEEIAERAGITKPVIYDHFGSKDGLLAATIARAREELHDRTVHVWRSLPPDAGPEEGMRRSVRAFFDFIDAHRGVFALIQQEGGRGTAVATGVEAVRTEQADLAVRILSRAAGLQDVPEWVLRGYAEVVGGTCERVAVWRLRTPGMSAEDATEIVMTVTWHGLSSVLG
ncbi:putative transcriptional regulator [Nostocoides japonicum T1-X7]|uniref:Putative transcriptional regulator n=1 Tax=Nostocoides japonicum T1-X7 TaxID=1194083 RepID=A0A077LTQ9_9MICO|nr:TetR/AcrR family transcriptional regulator [Tetrasphaera japonica]CCH77023.1 putative transcriptional regulator [Tetrasphaera japonica T1-X7]